MPSGSRRSPASSTVAATSPSVTATPASACASPAIDASGPRSGSRPGVAPTAATGVRSPHLGRISYRPARSFEMVGPALVAEPVAALRHVRPAAAAAVSRLDEAHGLVALP